MRVSRSVVDGRVRPEAKLVIMSATVCRAVTAGGWGVWGESVWRKGHRSPLRHPPGEFWNVQIGRCGSVGSAGRECGVGVCVAVGAESSEHRSGVVLACGGAFGMAVEQSWVYV